MYLKVDYQNVGSIGSYFVEQSHELNKRLDTMNNLLDELASYWKGPDYDNYKEVYGTYLKNCKTSSIELNAIGNALSRIGYYYGEADMDFGIKTREMGNNDGRK
jgi:uncharacterized protein YukE